MSGSERKGETFSRGPIPPHHRPASRMVSIPRFAFRPSSFFAGISNLETNLIRENHFFPFFFVFSHRATSIIIAGPLYAGCGAHRLVQRRLSNAHCFVRILHDSPLTDCDTILYYTKRSIHIFITTIIVGKKK